MFEQCDSTFWAMTHWKVSSSSKNSTQEINVCVWLTFIFWNLSSSPSITAAMKVHDALEGELKLEFEKMVVT